MSTFRPGQRVRLVNVRSPRNGCEAKIISHEYTRHVTLGAGYFYRCDVSGWGTHCPIEGSPFAYAEWQLEPIVPEGMQPTTWDKCLWQPEGVAV